MDFFERKTKLDARYRSKVAETMNYAFDAYKQGKF